MKALIMRDLKLAYRHKSQWLSGIFFFLLFITLSIFAFDNQIKPSVAGGLIWLAALYSLLLNFSGIFQQDMADGAFDQLYLSGLSPLSMVTSKAVASFVIGYLPIILASPIAALFFGLDLTSLSAIMISLLIGATGIICYALFAAALLAGQKSGTMVVFMMTCPFLIPILIFGISAIDSFPSNGILTIEFQALAGLSLIGLAIALPAAAAALSTYLD